MDAERMPEDICATAWKVLCTLPCMTDVCSYRRGCGCFDHVAGALLDERERCAKIANEWAADGDHSGCWAVAQIIEDTIRTPSPATSE